MDTLIDDNLLCLQRAVEIIARLSPADYTKPCATADNSTAADHLRLITDHYQAFLIGIGSGAIDYSTAERDPQLESDPLYAAAVMRGIIMGLEQFEEHLYTQELRIKKDAGDTGEWRTSTPHHELHLLLAHANHHFAIIATLLHANTGTPLPRQVDVAPDSHSE
ncbi:MAG: hypothetical protein SFY80_14710 [Verrucomicrobiota bacterium]|nr:hypothetical protein [Verrucomicrobiota bacterium]